MGETIFLEEEEHNDVDCSDPEPSPLDAPVEPASTTSVDGPDITSSTTLGPFEPEPAESGGNQATILGEANSLREVPRNIQCHHPPQQMIWELHERVTHSKSR